MAYKPGDNFNDLFDTYGTDGSSSDADALPTAKVYHNGTFDAAVTVNVAEDPIAAGLYLVTFVIPGSYSVGDRVQVRAVGTMAGKVSGNVIASFRLEGLGGPNLVTLTFKDETNTLVPLVPFKILPTGAVGRAGVNGTLAFGLPDGTYTVVPEATGTVLFTATTLTVSSTTTLTIQGQGHTIMPPTEPGVCAIEWTAYASGSVTPKDGVNYYARYLSGPPGTSVDGREMVFTSDGTNPLNTRMECFQGFEMEIRRGMHGPRRKFVVPSRTTAYMTDSDVLGADLIGPDS